MRVRAWSETLFAGLTAGLTVVTLVSRDWIEAVFGVDADQDSGVLEWLIVFVCALLAVTSGLRARRSWRRARLAGS